MSTKESFLRRQDRIGLRLYFEKKYSPENFVNIYRHLDGFLDITGSTALGKHYCIGKLIIHYYVHWYAVVKLILTYATYSYVE